MIVGTYPQSMFPAKKKNHLKIVCFYSQEKLQYTAYACYRNVFSLICYSNSILHYEKTPVQYTAIFHGCKNDNFQMKNCDVFLIFAQNIDCGYTLELPQ